MGRKGVSKRKPKKTRPFSSADIGGFTNNRSGELPPVSSQAKKSDVTIDRGGANPFAGSNQSQKKH